MLSDTSPDAEAVLIKLIRQADVAERMARMRSLTALATRLSRRAIAETRPELSPREVDLMWVELHYGRRLAAELRRYLKATKCR
jgi:hypothetical protein